MTGRDRLLRTLGGHQADRVPVAPFLYYNNVYEMFGYTPDIETFFDPPDFDPIVGFVDYCDYFGFDILHTLGSVWDFYAASSTYHDLSFARPWDNWDVKIEEQRRSDGIRRTVVISTPDGNLKFIGEHRRSSTHLVVTALVEYPIRNRGDFEMLRRYCPPPDEMDCTLIPRAREAVGDRGLVSTCTHGVFNNLAQFRRLEDLLVDPIVDEAFYREMMEFSLECLVKRARVLVDAGAEVLEVGGNLATSAVGPDFYRNYVLEYESRLLRTIRDLGVLNIFHNCGDAAKIMHLYNEMPIDCWGYLTPPPAGDVDLDEALRVIRPTMALRGNIDQVEFMVKAHPEEIRETVRALLGKVKPRGNWILSTTDFFFDGCPYANIQAFAQAGLDFGQYA